MLSQVTNLKNGKTVDKPIYNHVTGALDPVETVSATDIVIFEGLHPMCRSAFFLSTHALKGTATR